MQEANLFASLVLDLSTLPTGCSEHAVVELLGLDQ
jgi:hypothetical protein